MAKKIAKKPVKKAAAKPAKKAAKKAPAKKAAVKKAVKKAPAKKAPAKKAAVKKAVKKAPAKKAPAKKAGKKKSAPRPKPTTPILPDGGLIQPSTSRRNWNRRGAAPLRALPRRFLFSSLPRPARAARNRTFLPVVLAFPALIPQNVPEDH